MPRPKQYDNDADRARAWRERRAGEMRDALAMRLRDADDETLDRLVHMLPMPGLMRLSRALEWAEHPERAPQRGQRRHGPPRGERGGRGRREDHGDHAHRRHHEHGHHGHRDDERRTHDEHRDPA